MFFSLAASILSKKSNLNHNINHYYTYIMTAKFRHFASKNPLSQRLKRPRK